MFSARQPVLASCLLALVDEVGCCDENCTQQQRTTTERSSTRPTVGEDSTSDGATDQDTERTTEHVETKAGSDRAHVGRHGGDARALERDEGACKESVEQSPDNETNVRCTNGGPAEGENCSGTGTAAKDDKWWEELVGNE